MKKRSAIYPVAFSLLFMIQACDPFNEGQNASEIQTSNGSSTLRMSAPDVLVSSRAVDTSQLGVEVVVSYSIDGTPVMNTGLATPSGNSTWELDIGVPVDTDFNISMTWFEQSIARLDLVRIARNFSGLSSDGRLSFNQDFTSTQGLSNDPQNADFVGFDADSDQATNLDELIAGSDPFNPLSPDNDVDPPENLPVPTGLIVSASVGDAIGTFLTGSPPDAIGSIALSSFDSETLDTIITGGSIELPVSASEPFSSLYVVTEPDRYFAIQLPQSVSETSLVLTAATDFGEITEANVTVLVENSEAEVSIGQSVSISTLEVSTGELQVSVSWDQLTDVDLHLLTPSGERIFWQQPNVGDGMLDLDSNAGCFLLDGVNNENISFGDNDAPPGRYEVFVNYFDNCDVTEPTQYLVTVRANNTTETFSGSFVPADVASPRRSITVIEIFDEF